MLIESQTRDIKMPEDKYRKFCSFCHVNAPIKVLTFKWKNNSTHTSICQICAECLKQFELFND